MRETTDRQKFSGLTCGYVLAGGKSSRMGRPKGDLQLGGKTLTRRAAETLYSSVPEVKVVANTPPADLAIEAIPDIEIAGAGGPLVGLYSALMDSRGDWIAVLACDLPFVSADVMRRLASIERGPFGAVVPVQPNGWPQPLSAIYRRERCLARVLQMLNFGDMKLQNVLSGLDARYVEFGEIADLAEPANIFLNVNGPEDYKTAVKIVGG